MVNPVLLIAVPLGLAFSVPLFGLVSRKITRLIPSIAMLFNLVSSILLMPKVIKNPWVVSIGGFPPPFSINLFVGPVGILFSSVIALVGLIISIYAFDYIERAGIKEHKSTETEEKYHMLYLTLLVGATGAVLTGDIFNLFVFFEILCISSYALVAYLGNKAGLESACKYLIQGSIGSSFVLIGIALIYGRFGTLNMAEISAMISPVNQMEVVLPLFLLITGFGIETAIFPLNAWLPDAHSSAPSTISALLSGIAIKIGIYAVARIVFTIFGAVGTGDTFLFILLLGLLTLLVGEISAFSQNNIKRMLAYSSTGQIGLILFAMGTATIYGVTGGLFQFITHALSKSLLFLSVGYMLFHSGSMEISSLEGMGRKMPLSSLFFTIGVFSLIGLPPFIGFPSKIMIIFSALSKQSILYTFFTGAVLLGTVVEGIYFFKVIQTIYFKGSTEDVKIEEAPISALIPMGILVLFILFIGVYPQILTGILNISALEILDRFMYIKEVLG